MSKSYKNQTKKYDRRLHFDDYDAKIYDNLRKSYGLFKNLQYIDVFSIALIYGLKEGYRTPLEKKGSSIGRVVESVIDNSELRYLMKIIAVDEENSLDVLLDADKYFTISEEYAKTGLKILEQDFIENEELLDDMELELYQCYDKIFSQKEEDENFDYSDEELIDFDDNSEADNNSEVYNTHNKENKELIDFDEYSLADDNSEVYDIYDDENDELVFEEEKSEKFITFLNGNFKINKTLNGTMRNFGTYPSLENARLARDILIENDWNIDMVPIELFKEMEKYPYIKHQYGRFVITKKIEGILRYFGTFDNLKDAIAQRNRLIANNWEMEEIIQEEKVDEYIFCIDDLYIVKKEINGEIKVFGTFNDMFEAIDFRNLCVKKNWNLN